MRVAVVKAGPESPQPIELMEVEDALEAVMRGRYKFLGQDLIPAELLNKVLFNIHPPFVISEDTVRTDG